MKVGRKGKERKRERKGGRVRLNGSEDKTNHLKSLRLFCFSFQAPNHTRTFSTRAFFLAGAGAAPPATDCRRKVKSFSFFITPAAAGTPAAALGGAKARDLPAGALFCVCVGRDMECRVS